MGDTVLFFHFIQQICDFVLVCTVCLALELDCRFIGFHQFTAELDDSFHGAAVCAVVLIGMIRRQILLTELADLNIRAVEAMCVEDLLDAWDIGWLHPQIIDKLQQIGFIRCLATVQPRIRFHNAVVTQKLAVGDRIAGCTHGVHDAVHHHVKLLGDSDRFYFFLHFAKLIHCELYFERCVIFVLFLFFQKSKTLFPVLDVFCFDLQIKTIQQREIFAIFRIIRIGHFIGGTEKRNRGQLQLPALVCIKPFVECSQKRVEHAAVRLKQFVQHHNICFRDFPSGEQRRSAAVKGGKHRTHLGQDLALLRHLEQRFLCRDFFVILIKCFQRITHLYIGLIAFQHVAGNAAWNQTGHVQPAEQLFLVGLIVELIREKAGILQAIGKQADGRRFGLPVLSENKQVASCEQGNRHIPQKLAPFGQPFIQRGEDCVHFLVQTGHFYAPFLKPSLGAAENTTGAAAAPVRSCGVPEPLRAAAGNFLSQLPQMESGVRHKGCCKAVYFCHLQAESWMQCNCSRKEL